jgi:sulfur-carrier protein
MIRVVLPPHLRGLARLSSAEISLEVTGAATLRTVLDALEGSYPMLRGTIRDHVTQQRRPFLRFFACEEDLSHEALDTPLPEAVVSGKEPLLIVGAIAGGSFERFATEAQSHGENWSERINTESTAHRGHGEERSTQREQSLAEGKNTTE